MMIALVAVALAAAPAAQKPPEPDGLWIHPALQPIEVCFGRKACEELARRTGKAAPQPLKLIGHSASIRALGVDSSAVPLVSQMVQFEDASVAAANRGDARACVLEARTYVVPKHWLCIPEGPMRFQLLASAPPPTRTRVAFDSANGDHVEVEWEPFESARLSKAVTLGAGVWQTSLWSAPARDAFNAAVDFRWSQEDVVSAGDFGLVIKVSAMKSTAATDGGAHFAESEASISIWGSRPLGITEAARMVGVREGGVLGGPPATGRAFGAPIEQQAQDLLFLVAEIVVERARSRGFDLLADRIRKTLCDEIVLSGEPAAALVGSEEARVVLPRTCALVKSLRIQDVASTGVPLLHALTEDALLFATEVQITNLRRSRLDANALAILVDVIAYAGGLATEAAVNRQQVQFAPQQLLIRLARQNWLAVSPESPERATACAVQISFAVIAACHANSCDARAIHDFIDNAPRYFDLEGCDLERAGQAWPQMERFIAGGLQLLAPPPSMTHAQQSRLAVDMALDVAMQFELARFGNRDVAGRLREMSYTRNGAGRVDLAGGSVALLQTVRAIFDGALEGDFQPLLTGLSAILASSSGDPALHAALLRATTLTGAVTSYFATYGQDERDGDPAFAEGRRAARKQAIESLIDAATDRSGRTDAWLVSLTGSLRAMGGVQRVRGEGEGFGRWSLPLGVSVTWLGKTGAGFYGEAAPIDLGRYVDLREGKLSSPSVTDAFGAFLSAGYQFGGSMPVIAGVTGGFVPRTPDKPPGADGTVETGRPEVWMLTGFVGIAVPLFDFN